MKFGMQSDLYRDGKFDTHFWNLNRQPSSQRIPEKYRQRICTPSRWHVQCAYVKYDDLQRSGGSPNDMGIHRLLFRALNYRRSFLDSAKPKGEEMSEGIKIRGEWAKSKKAVKEACATNPDDVVVHFTSAFTSQSDSRLSQLSRGTLHFVGPDPYSNRKFYGTIAISEDGKIKVT